MFVSVWNCIVVLPFFTTTAYEKADLTLGLVSLISSVGLVTWGFVSLVGLNCFGVETTPATFGFK